LARALPALLLAALLSHGCRSAEERAEAVRGEVAAALQQGDRSTALRALADLRKQGTPTPEQARDLATLLVQAGEAPEAVWILEDAVAAHPERPDLRLLLGRAALLIKDPSRARAAVAPIPPEAEEHPAALLVGAQAQLELGDLDGALARFREAMERYPDRPEATLARVQALLQERKLDEARVLVDEGISNPRLPDDARRRLAIVAAGLDAEAGRNEGAERRLSELVAAKPEDPVAWNALLRLLLANGRGEDAVARLQDAIQRGPDTPLLRGLLAESYAAMGRPDDAAAQLAKRVELEDTPSARIDEARFHARRGDAQRVAALMADAERRHPDDPMIQLNLAESRIATGDVAGARHASDTFREARPDDPQNEYLRARLDLATGRAGDAVERLQKLVPRLDTASTQYWLGRALEETGDLRGAARRYGLAATRDPRDPAAPAAVERLAIRRGDWATAAAAARQLIARTPADLGAQERLVHALLELGDAKTAEELARRLAKRDPDRSGPVLLLARAEREQGRHAEAKRTLDEAIARLGPRPELEAESALALGVAGRLAEGIAGLEALAAEHPDEAVVHRLLAILLFARGDVEAGSRATDRALALAPDDPAPLAMRARFHASRRSWAPARVDVQRYLTARPDDAAALFLLGAIEQGDGRRDAAMAAYRRAGEIDERSFAARNNLALLMAETGDLPGALAQAQAAHAIQPDSAAGLDTLGWLYLRSGLVDRAVAFLERAHAADPALDDARLHLALAYREAGRPADALPLLQGVAAGTASPELRAEAERALAASPAP
jgi:tetratricopeptide (TPR) repeat protein